MSYVKYTKTSTFLFPLLEISKSLFQCNVEGIFGKIITNRFLNSYLIDSDLDSKEFNEGPYVFLVIKNYRDKNFESFYHTLTSKDNYVDEYEKFNFLIVVFKISDKFLIDYNLLLKGKYSKLSHDAKTLILNNAFYSGKSRVTLTYIFSKSPKLKKSWEKRLSCPGSSEVDLKNKEVWSIIRKEKETFNDELLKNFSKNQKMSPNKEFK